MEEMAGSWGTQLRDQAIERRLRVPVERAQDRTVSIGDSRDTETSRNWNFAASATPIIGDHAGLCRVLHQPVPLGHGRDAERLLRRGAQRTLAD